MEKDPKTRILKLSIDSRSEDGILPHTPHSNRNQWPIAREENTGAGASLWLLQLEPATRRCHSGAWPRSGSLTIVSEWEQKFSSFISWMMIFLFFSFDIQFLTNKCMGKSFILLILLSFRSEPRLSIFKTCCKVLHLIVKVTFPKFSFKTETLLTKLLNVPLLQFPNNTKERVTQKSAIIDPV